MNTGTEVLIVGGGVIGAAILFELTQRGTPARLIDRGPFAGESTGKSAAIVRSNYSNPEVVRMALRSCEIFATFEQYVGIGSPYVESGWVLAVPPEEMEKVVPSIQMNRAEGVDVREIDLVEATRMLPGLRSEGLAALYLEPRSGYADPVLTTRSYITASLDRGAIATEGCDVRELVLRDRRVVGVRTVADEVIEADLVVLAAGPWSAKLAATVGVDLPYMVTREEEVYLQVPAAEAPSCVLSSVADRIYLRPGLHGRKDLFIVGRGFPKPYEVCDPDSYTEEPTASFETDIRERLQRRFQALSRSPVVGGVVGLYAATPDWHPYIGAIDGVEGLYLATGGSGHCFKLAPAIGELVANDIAGGNTPYAEVSSFSLARLAEGRTFGAAIGGNRG